ncbi:MAG: rhomboid family intramembrane serine protease [Crocinitomicaceae bacterium]
MQPIVELKKPIFTLLLSISCCAIFLLLQMDTTSIGTDEVYSRLGAPFAIQIYQGQYWGVITNSLLHINYYHLIINLFGLWALGAFIERRVGLINFILLGLYASIMTSIAQLTLSDDAGIGLTGVNYFFVAYIFIKSAKNSRFQLRAKYIYLIVAIAGIIIAYYLNNVKYYNIGITAMISGLFFGFITGLTTLDTKKSTPVIFAIVLFISSGVTLFYSPWSAEWNYFKGYSAHEASNYDDAKMYYKDAININPAHKASFDNLKLISIDEISDSALNAHKNKEYLRARKLYQRVLKLDPNNHWAKQNMAKLP